MSSSYFYGVDIVSWIFSLFVVGCILIDSRRTRFFFVILFFVGWRVVRVGSSKRFRVGIGLGFWTGR